MITNPSVQPITKGFKPKTIQKILNIKFASWAKSITDENVRVLVEENTIITGGAIASMLMGQVPNDFDVYLKTPEAAKAVAEYYVKKLQENPPKAFEAQAKDIKVLVEPAIEAGKKEVRVGGYAGLLTEGPQPPRVRIVVANKNLRGEEMASNHEGYQISEGEVTDNTEPFSYEGNTEALDNLSSNALVDSSKTKNKEKFHVLFVTANAITLSDQIQIVLRFNGDIAEIHKNYDFVHCLNAWDSKTKQLHINFDSLLAINSQELRYQGSKYPLASVIRTRKFISRGWTINAGQYVKMAFQISQLDLKDPAVLEDQLVGVDSAYFTLLIRQLTKDMDEKLEADPHAARTIDGGHLLTLIDKIF